MSRNRSAQEVADRLAIHELYARYAQVVDLADGTAYAECFTADGWTDISSFGHTAATFRERGLDVLDDDGKVRGRDNLRRVATKSPGAPVYRHITANVWITSYEGERATGTALFLVISPEGTIHQFGQYDDVLVLDSDGQWRIAERLDLASFNSGTTLHG